MRQQWFLALRGQPAIKVSQTIWYVMKGPEMARKWMEKLWGMKWVISVYYLYGTVNIYSWGPSIHLSATCNQSMDPQSLDMIKSKAVPLGDVVRRDQSPACRLFSLNTDPAGTEPKRSRISSFCSLDIRSTLLPLLTYPTSPISLVEKHLVKLMISTQKTKQKQIFRKY